MIYRYVFTYNLDQRFVDRVCALYETWMSTGYLTAFYRIYQCSAGYTLLHGLVWYLGWLSDHIKRYMYPTKADASIKWAIGISRLTQIPHMYWKHHIAKNLRCCEADIASWPTPTLTLYMRRSMNCITIAQCRSQSFRAFRLTKCDMLEAALWTCGTSFHVWDATALK